LFAAVPGQENSIIVSTADGYQMLNLKGAFPGFSNDGQYLFYIHENKLIKLPVSLDEIHSLVFDKRIFGNPETGRQVWLLL
jgi:hypothetical protein